MELPDIGSNCSFDGCRELDFLPMRCEYCAKTFCSRHGAVYSHRCPNAPERTADLNNNNNDNNNNNVPVTAYTRPARTGPKDIRPDARKQLTDAQQAALDSVRQNKAGQPHMALKPSTKPRVSPKIELMRLKASAKGNASIDAKDRLYLCIRWKTKTISVFINKRSVVGNAAGQFAKMLGASLLPDTVYRLQAPGCADTLQSNAVFSDIIDKQLDGPLYNGCTLDLVAAS